MSCLTRQLQQQLAKYIKKEVEVASPCDPSVVREELINRGVCPSAITEGQVRQVLEVAGFL
ncbi:hypothetical protein [uncultured Alteromonas sp.]|jgi:predicted nuclease of restriction endonuclease-like RecB superfamily|uniref:hypothetical protein n=1 Tax=uncultured Alteromonas sp. TaxID=179113 RepID=UPI0025EB3939|nr:hypothetical protein [uncultured Alteromonas sp.]